LQEQPRKVVVALAARSALRVLPMMGAMHRPSSLVLAVFRAAAVSWVEANYPAHALAAAAAAAGATAAAARASGPATYAAAAAADAAYCAAYANADDAAAAAAAAIDDAADAAFSAARAGNPGAYAAGDSAYDSVYSVLEMDASAVDNGQGTAVILASKLWPDGDPRECTRLWNALKRDLLSEGPDWHVWTDWYDARLIGKGSNEKLEVARLTISDEIWEQGPAIVNAEIKRLIANYARRPRKKSNPKPAIGVPPDLPAPIENVPSALSFGWSSELAGFPFSRW
jgi:hypothetical protein